MSRLNYNKWDALELSDDSDIEVHPNVDKKSMIRWKQRDIHEKRELRKLKLHHFELETAMNKSLLARIQQLIDSTQSSGPSFISSTVSQLHAKVPDFAMKKFADGEQPSEDHMILALLTQVVNAVEKQGKGEEGRTERLVKELQVHAKRLQDRQEEIVKEKAFEEKEAKKFITSDDLHMGFESKTIISSKPSAAPKETTKKSSAGKGKATETTIETLNSPAVKAAQESAADSSDEEEDAAELTPAARRFSNLKPLDFAACFSAISDAPELLDESTTDSLLVEAFTVAMKGDAKRARECVEKALMIQYCLKLGRDGVSLYFKRMTSSDPKALKMFLEDVATTSQRIIDQAQIVAEEKRKEREENPQGIEQIQLVASDENTVINFEIPEGPPPENLEITGEGAEELDPVLVRDFLQRRWDVFQAFDEKLRTALKSKSLDKVNKVLGKMSVNDAEHVVKQLQEGGILSFETNEIVDQTHQVQAENSVRVPAPEASVDELD